MDCLDITYYWPILSIFPIKRASPRAISNILSQIPSLDHVSYLFLQLEIILYIVIVILVEFTVLVLISSEGVDLNLLSNFTKSLFLISMST